MILNDPRVLAYTAAAIQGMLSSEPSDVEYNARYIAERAQEIVQYSIALEDGEDPTAEEDLFYGVPSEHVPAGEFEPDPDPEDPPSEEQQEQSCFHRHTEKILVTTRDEFTPEDGVGTNLQAVWGSAQTED